MLKTNNQEQIQSLYDIWYVRNHGKRKPKKLIKLAKALGFDELSDIFVRENTGFREYYNLTVKDLVWMQDWFMKFASNSDQFKKYCGDHYFLKHILEDDCLEWQEWEKKISPTLKEWIEIKFPQLMVTDNYYSKIKLWTNKIKL